MYILVMKCKAYPVWHLVSRTGLVIARSDRHGRLLDAVRRGKQVAKELGIKFKYE